MRETGIQKKELNVVKPEKAFKVASIVALLNGLVVDVILDSLIATAFDR
jgi:hypothetical protein